MKTLPASTRRLQLALLTSAPTAFAIIALLLGKKTGWDLYNYHWYTPFALLNDRFGFDVAVSHHATYYNPVADLPLYLVASHGPSWLGGALMGALAGVAIALVGAIAYRSLSIENVITRTWCATLLAVLGATGAGAWQEIGDPANDIPAGIGIFSALLFVLSYFKNRERDTARHYALVLAGLFAGAAVGLKLTAAVYAVGIVIGLALAAGTLRERSLRLIYFGAGAICGLIACGGFWMLQMWQFSGNPFFPYFNDLFHSPLVAATSYRDPNFRPDSFFTALLFPFHFTIESRTVSESVFRDGHILAIYILIPVTVAIAYTHRVRAGKQLISKPMSFLFVFAFGSYAAWLAIFDIYRYLIPLEMLSPLLIALAFSLWPIRTTIRIALVVATLAILQAIVRVDLSDRQSWQGPYVHVAVPALPDSEKTMILMTGHAPMAYVIPSFPREIPFVRIDSWLVQGSDHVTGLAQTMRAQVSAHQGPLYLLLAPTERGMALDALRHYELQLVDDSPCQKVTSNIDDELLLCPISRVAN